MKLTKHIAYLSLSVLILSKVNAQKKLQVERVDSLKNKSYEDLYNSYYNAGQDDSLQNLYAFEYLNKAYKENDTLNIATAYYIISTYERENSLPFLDSLIKYSEKIGAYNWLWSAHFDKGSIFNSQREFKKALSSHVKAYHYAIDLNDLDYLDKSITSLGIIKEKIGRHKEALIDFKTSLRYTSSLVKGKSLDSIDEKSGVSHLHTLHLLSNSYRLNNKLDSATLINNEVQKFRGRDWAKKYLNEFTLNAAEVHYDRKQYKQAIDSAESSIPLLLENNNPKNVAIAYYIKGMSEYKLGDYNNGIKSLEKMDSIYSMLGSIYLAVRPGYTLLRNHYKSKNNIKKQLYYVERLLKFDSIAHDNYAYISEELVNKIDRPKLINEKKELSQKLNSSNKRITIISIGFSITFIVLVTEFLRRRRLKKQYQRRFDALLDRFSKMQIISEQDSKDIRSNKCEIGIEQSVVDIILEKLDIFEQKKHYTKKNITATKLAKELGTNANYLGRIIKHYRNKSFRNYINDLRIELALKKIRNDKKFVKYSVIAMAKEVGFKNSEPFAKAFKAKTNLNPSDFIEKLRQK